MTISQIDKNARILIGADRDVDLLNLNISVDDFAGMVTITYDDRWKDHHWRVRGDDCLQHWIHDVYSPRDQDLLTDNELISKAYGRFTAIQARRGQMNFNDVYVTGRENVEVAVSKNKFEHATVTIVQDCIDGLWRWATGYWVVNGGASSAPSLTHNIVKTRDDAILAGAEELYERITDGWQYREANDAYRTFVGKIENFISDKKSGVSQPSLFAF